MPKINADKTGLTEKTKESGSTKKCRLGFDLKNRLMKAGSGKKQQQPEVGGETLQSYDVTSAFNRNLS